MSEEKLYKLEFIGLPDQPVKGSDEVIPGKSLYNGDGVSCNLEKPDSCFVSFPEGIVAGLLNDFPDEWKALDIKNPKAFVKEYYRNQAILAEAIANKNIKVVYPDGSVEEYDNNTRITFSTNPIRAEVEVAPPAEPEVDPEPNDDGNPVEQVLSANARNIKKYFNSLDEADVEFAKQSLSYENENENRKKVVSFLVSYIAGNSKDEASEGDE